MTNKVEKACKQNSEGIHSGKKFDKTIKYKTAGTVKTDFVRDGLSYLKYLFSKVLRQAGLRFNIIKGLATFDPFVIFKRLKEVELRHFAPSSPGHG